MTFKLILLKTLGALPLPVLHAFGAAIGLLFYLVPNRRRRTAQINIALCFPELSPWRRGQLLRRHLIGIGKTATETAVLWTCGKARLRRLLRRVSGEDVFHAAVAEGRGAIIAAPHLGAWEIVGISSATHYPVTGLYRVLDHSGKRDVVQELRARFGGQMVPTDKSGIRALYRALERGEVIWIMPDQVPTDGSGVFAPFFGVQTNTMVLLSRLAAKNNTPVVVAFAERLSFGRGYHLHFVRAPREINDSDVKISATALNAAIERCVRAVPDQYQWIYKRFRGRPLGERKLY